MNDIDQFEAMDEMSDWAVANARLLADMGRSVQTQRHLDTPTNQPGEKVIANIGRTDARPADAQGN